MNNGLDEQIRKLGRSVLVVHGPTSLAESFGGRDIDCLVAGPNETWPLQLDEGWIVCQCFQYDVAARYWIVEKGGTFIAIDCTEDPRGIGKYGLPTTLIENRGVSPSAVTAAYLLSKGIRKGIGQAEVWENVRQLASKDLEGFRIALDHVFGRRSSTILSSKLNDVPTERTFKTALFLQLVKRFGSPMNFIHFVSREVSRFFIRVTEPTGLFVLIVGPDGVGKSTLAQELAESCSGLFRRVKRVHWRPQVLPRPGALVGQTTVDHNNNPHGERPHGIGLSILLSLYYWIDFFAGSVMQLLPFRIRSGLILMERGWIDLAIDPLRYRLRISVRAVKLLNRFLKTPDLTIVLRASPNVLTTRKNEISEVEMSRQNGLLTEMFGPDHRARFVNTERPMSVVEMDVRRLIVGFLADRAMSRAGAGWVNLSKSGRVRWILPRGPKRVAFSALSLYRPNHPRAYFYWITARVASRVGLFRLLKRGGAPPRPVLTRLAAHIPFNGSIAVASSSHPGRYITSILDSRGHPQVMFKVALTAKQDQALKREASLINELARFLPQPLVGPEILLQQDGLLGFEPFEWKPALRPWRLSEKIARALGQFFVASRDPVTGLGACHGDFAPWNLMEGRDGRWLLIDWEMAQKSGQPPFFDLFHFLVQAHSLLGRPSESQLIEGLRYRGWVGDLVEAYANEVGVKPDAAWEYFGQYLRISGTQTYVGSRAREGMRQRTLLHDLWQKGDS